MSVETTAVPDRLVNVRDVGAASPLLRTAVLLRSDAPRAGDVAPADVAWPPRTVLDLRDVDESSETHPLRGVADVVALPVLTGATTRAGSGTQPAPFELGRLYLEMLDGPGAAHLVAGVRAVAEDPSPVLVHCTAGKDRTGVLVALVLDLVGVDRASIVADYVRTDASMPQVLLRARATARAPRRDTHVVAALPPELLTAPAHAVEAVLDVLAAHDDGAVGWFTAHGGDVATVSALRERLRR
ncbi:tyrosine-protein phosphatase [Isoptericola halotolerans]|uniref:tyrosine-protein phosphatase n=1 Tax=Isoptericola halotolerans TaxID=300560 RepID=UPI00388E3F26